MRSGRGSELHVVLIVYNFFVVKEYLIVRLISSDSYLKQF
jgi:hypothetical protein